MLAGTLVIRIRRCRRRTSRVDARHATQGLSVRAPRPVFGGAADNESPSMAALRRLCSPELQRTPPAVPHSYYASSTSHVAVR